MKPNQLNPSGESNLGIFGNYQAICESEYQVKYENLLDEYKAKKSGLVQFKDLKIEESKFISQIVDVNTAMLDNRLQAPELIKLELAMSDIDYNTANKSMTLDFWRKEIGEGKAITITCDIMSYFFRQFTVKEKLDGAQIMQLAIKLYTLHPSLKIKELIHCLSLALNGNYGAFYERISISKVSEWLSQYYEDSAVNAETEYYKNKSTESRGASIVDPMEVELRNFEKLQKAKKQIVDDVYKAEKSKEAKEKRNEEFRNKTLNNE